MQLQLANVGGFAGAPPSSGRRRRPPPGRHTSLMNMRRYDYEICPAPNMEYGGGGLGRVRMGEVWFMRRARPRLPVITAYLVRARAAAARRLAQSRFRWRVVRPASPRRRVRSALRTPDASRDQATAATPAMRRWPPCRASSQPASDASPSVLAISSPLHTHRNSDTVIRLLVNTLQIAFADMIQLATIKFGIHQRVSTKSRLQRGE